MANYRLRDSVWWRKWGKKDWTIAGIGFAILSFALIVTLDSASWIKENNQNRPISQNANLVDLTLLPNAKEKGAVCLDGSSPGYHFQKGFGSGLDNWVLHIEGFLSPILPNPSPMANSRLRDSVWWRKWGKKDWTIAGIGFAILSFALIVTLDSSSWIKENNQNRPISQNANLVDLTLLPNAKEKGAVCLDGSSPGYHFQKGFGSGLDNWVLHIEGGGWCNSLQRCSKRKSTALGSSDFMDSKVPFSGILSQEALENPDFFNWNKVKIRYCDGASLAGNPEGEFHNGTKIFFRGQRIWQELMDELKSLGLANAKQALLSGCSAGGLATLIHCDGFRKVLNNDANVKCLSDAGFFLDVKDISGSHIIRSFYKDVVHLQGVVKSLHQDCLSKMEPHQCFFPEEIIKYIKTPVFLVNPAYDFWQIQNILVPDASDPHHIWHKCRLNIEDCDSNQMEILQGFRSSLLKALSELQQKKDSGIFVNSCFIHCQTWMTNTWHGPNSPRVNNVTIAEAVGDWYFSRREVKLIDCPYPCNPTCFNMDFSKLR